MMSKLQVCRVCLASDVKLYNMHQHQLVSAYEHLTATELITADGLPQLLCSFCSALLIKCTEFQEKCINTMLFLNNAIELDSKKKDCYQKLICDEAKNLTLPYGMTEILFLNLIDNENIHSDMLKNNEPYKEKDIEENIVIQKCEIKVEFSDGDYEHELTNNMENDCFDKSQSETENGLDISHSNSQDSYVIVQAKSATQVIKIENVKEIKKLDMNKKSDMGPEQTNKEVNDGIKLAGSSCMSPANVAKKRKIGTKVKTVHELPKPLPDMSIVHLSVEEQKTEVEMRKQSGNYKRWANRCDLCFKGFICEEILKNHIKMVHDPSYPHVCELCNATYQKRSRLKCHIMNSHAFNYVCKQCDMVCKSRALAEKHVKWHQGITYKCTMCDATFRKESSKLGHMRRSHASQIVCPLCGESFLSQLGLKYHFSRAHRGQKIESNKELQCSCGVEFKASDALEKHVGLRDGNSCDTNMRPCIECGLSFETKLLLNKHVREYHKVTTVKRFENTSFVKKRPPRPAHFVCEICGVRYPSHGTLLEHQLMHTGEKPHKCDICPKRFRMHTQYKVHLRVHTGERPYICRHCSKTFKSASALHRHNKIHTGERPHCCDHCGKSFTQSQSLRGHIRTVHFKLPDASYNGKKKKKIKTVLSDDNELNDE